MPSRKQVGVGLILGSVALVVAVGGLLGSLASAGTESFDVEVATYLPRTLAVLDNVDDTEYPEEYTATLIIAVNTPTGPHTGLLRDSFVVTAYCPSDDAMFTYRHPERVGFENLGGGFYRIDMIPRLEWWPMQYVFMVTAQSGRGSGVAVCELQTQPTLLNGIRLDVKDL